MADETDAPEGVVDPVDAPEAGVEAEPQAETPERSEVEELAIEMGWNPDYAGEDKKSAREFVKATRDIARTQSRDLKDMRRQLDGINRATAAMTERAIAQERAKWEAEHDRAVEDGDKEAARAATKHLADLDRQAQTQAHEAPPEALAFVERHSSWYGKDEKATRWAFTRCSELGKQGFSAAEQLEIVEREGKAVFPEHFSGKPATQQKAPPVLGTPARAATPVKREKTYATLPPAARKACDDWTARNQNRFDGKSVDQVRAMWTTGYYEDQEAANG